MNDISLLLDLLKDIVEENDVKIKNNNKPLFSVKNKNCIILMTAVAVAIKNYRLTTGNEELDKNLKSIRNKLVHLDEQGRKPSLNRRYNKIIDLIRNNYERTDVDKKYRKRNGVWSINNDLQLLLNEKEKQTAKEKFESLEWRN